jgi:hypothetical protein
MVGGGAIDLLLRLIGKSHVSGSQNFPLGPKLRVLFFASALPSIVGQLFILVLSMHSDLLLKPGLMRPTDEGSVRSVDDTIVIPARLELWNSIRPDAWRDQVALASVCGIGYAIRFGNLVD